MFTVVYTDMFHFLVSNITGDPSMSNYDKRQKCVPANSVMIWHRIICSDIRFYKSKYGVI